MPILLFIRTTTNKKKKKYGGKSEANKMRTNELKSTYACLMHMYYKCISIIRCKVKVMCMFANLLAAAAVVCVAN